MTAIRPNFSAAGPLRAPVSPVHAPVGTNAPDELRFGRNGQREGLVGRRRHDGSVEWVPASQAMRDQQRLSRWDSGKRGGGGSGGDDEDPFIKAIKELLAKVGIHL